MKKQFNVFCLLTVVLVGMFMSIGTFFHWTVNPAFGQDLPIPDVDVMPYALEIKSEATFNVYVTVSYNLTEEVTNASVVLSSDHSGTFIPAEGITDEEGFVTFAFTAPRVTTLLNVTITATVSAYGYSEGKGQATITVNPRILNVEVSAFPASVESGTTSTVIVHVAEDLSPVEGANVTLSSDAGGSFSVNEGITGESGDFQFDFISPETAKRLNVTITAFATKLGFASGEGQTDVSVTPAFSVGSIDVAGLPLTTLLLIIVPTVVFATVVILIKAKKINITRGK